MDSKEVIVAHLNRLRDEIPTSGTIMDAEVTRWLDRVGEVLEEYYMCIAEEEDV